MGSTINRTLDTQEAIGDFLLDNFGNHDSEYYNEKYGGIGQGHTKEIFGAGLSEGGKIVKDIGGYFNYIPHPLAKGFGMATTILGSATQATGDIIEGEKESAEIVNDVVDSGPTFINEIKKIF